MNTIAERIKFTMKVKNKKQIEIVRDTGISKGAFSSYLSGQYNPKPDKLQLIADSLDVDVKWLSGKNVPMQTGLMNEHSALVPRFYVLVNPSMNEIHLLPIFLKKDSSRFYHCPSELLTSDGHSTFTKDFDSVHIVLETSVIYYYVFSHLTKYLFLNILDIGTEPSDYIEILYAGNLGKEGKLMSDFEMLSLVMMILSIVVTILLAYINHTKK